MTPGSSPLARGLRARIPVAQDEEGIIPARAGFTGDPDPASGRHQDHPRSRGVYATTTSARLASSGSSPLARGLRGIGHPHHAGQRIIPARAGFTWTPRPARPTSRDHPRSRGVYRWAMESGSLSLGSSPLARGLHSGGGGLIRPGGIIPARAGFTIGVRAGGSSRADHPRSRGVYPWPIVPAAAVTRIIPARAGFTRRASSGRRSGRDHPRSRGVYARKSASDP